MRFCLRRFAAPAALAAIALGAAVAPASAQYFRPWGPGYWGPPTVYSEPGDTFDDSQLSPRAVAGILRSRGFRLVSAPQLRGKEFVAVGESADGRRVRFVIDAFDGDVIRTVRLDSARPAPVLREEPNIFDAPPPTDGPQVVPVKPKPKSRAAAHAPAAPKKIAPAPVAPAPSQATTIPAAPAPVAAPPVQHTAVPPAPAPQTPLAPDAAPHEPARPADIGPRVQPVPSEARAPVQPASPAAPPPGVTPPADAAPPPAITTPTEQPK